MSFDCDRFDINFGDFSNRVSRRLGRSELCDRRDRRIGRIRRKRRHRGLKYPFALGATPNSDRICANRPNAFLFRARRRIRGNGPDTRRNAGIRPIGTVRAALPRLKGPAARRAIYSARYSPRAYSRRIMARRHGRPGRPRHKREHRHNHKSFHSPPDYHR